MIVPNNHYKFLIITILIFLSINSFGQSDNLVSGGIATQLIETQKEVRNLKVQRNVLGEILLEVDRIDSIKKSLEYVPEFAKALLDTISPHVRLIKRSNSDTYQYNLLDHFLTLSKP